MGITTPLPAVCALATGSVGISPLDQASGYQTLANSGVHCKPFAVAEILQAGQILYRQRPDCQQVVPAPIANLVTDVLKGPVTYGTAASVFASGWGKWPIAGKTGTAQDNTNVWFAGYTRQVVTAVWVGSQGTPYPLADYWGYDVFGATVAAPIWKAFMLQVLQGYPAEQFPSGKLTTVPNVIGKPIAEARQLIRAAHLQTAAHIVPSYLPAGTVVAQDPSAGAQTVPTLVVSVSVSNGVAPIHTLPDVVGLTSDAATSTLGAIHVFVTVVDQAGQEAEQRRDRAQHGSGRWDQGQGRLVRDPRRRGRPQAPQPESVAVTESQTGEREGERQRSRRWRRGERRDRLRHPSRSLTLRCTVAPSTWPFARPITTPITLPKSPGALAPVSANASSMSASTCASVSWVGA